MGSSQLMLPVTRGHRAMPQQPQPEEAVHHGVSSLLIWSSAAFACYSPRETKGLRLCCSFSGNGNVFSHVANTELNKPRWAVKLLCCLQERAW